MKTFKTAKEAAIAALAIAAPLASRKGWEYGGWILKKGGGFTFLPAVTSEGPNSVNLIDSMEKRVGVSFDHFNATPFLRAIKAAGVVTTYHTHLCWEKEGVQSNTETYGDDTNGGSASWFSINDVYLDQTLQQFPSYIGVPCSGNVYETPREPMLSKVDVLMASLLGQDPPDFEPNGILVGNIRNA